MQRTSDLVSLGTRALTSSLTMIAALILPLQAQAVTFDVTVWSVDRVDTNPGDGECRIAGLLGGCTLRAAVMEANALPGSDDIDLPAGQTIVLTIEGMGNGSSAAHGDLDIFERLSISTQQSTIESEADYSLIDGSGTGDRIFDLHAGADVVFFGNMRMAYGDATDPAGNGRGGAINIRESVGDVVLRDVDIYGNVAVRGGAIYNRGDNTVTISDSLIHNNFSVESGAALVNDCGIMTVRRSSVYENGDYTIVNDRDLSGGGCILRIESSSLLDNGDTAIHSQGDSYLEVERATITGHDGTGIRLTTVIQGNEPPRVPDIRMTNTVLADNGVNCAWSGFVDTLHVSLTVADDLSCPTISQSNIVWDSSSLLLGTQDDPLSWHRINPPAPGSVLIDRGKSAELPGQCEYEDQRGNDVSRDGDYDGQPGCDIGAVELVVLPFIVNVGSFDAADTFPGDGACQSFGPPGDCTLRAAVMEANALSGPDVIILPTNETIVLTIEGEGDILFDTAAVGDLDIKSVVEIRTPESTAPADYPLIDASGLGDRIFDLKTSATFSGFRMAFGDATGFDSNGRGGAFHIRNSVFNVLIDQVEMHSNRAVRGGAIYNHGHNLNDVLIRNSLIHNNTVFEDGAALVNECGSMTIGHTSIYQNDHEIPGFGTTQAIVNERGANELLDGCSLNIRNSSILDNGHTGVLSRGDVELRFNHSTITGHTGRGILLNSAPSGSPSLRMRNTVLADNAVNCSYGNFVNSLNINGYNSADDTFHDDVVGADSGDSCQLTEGDNNVRADEFLSFLSGAQDDPLSWHRINPPAADSVLIDRGHPDVGAGCNPLDQRFVDRAQDGDDDGEARCDIGAVEFLQEVLLPEELFSNGFEG